MTYFSLCFTVFSQRGSSYHCLSYEFFWYDRLWFWKTNKVLLSTHLMTCFMKHVDVLESSTFTMVKALDSENRLKYLIKNLRIDDALQTRVMKGGTMLTLMKLGGSLPVVAVHHRWRSKKKMEEKRDERIQQQVIMLEVHLDKPGYP